MSESSPPLEWAGCIFTAHPTEPCVVARHLTSSVQFTLAPPSVASPKLSYLPPSLISAAPSSKWLFAFFPGRDTDGLACLWQRGDAIDSWAIKEYFQLRPGNSAVAFSWLHHAREWTTDPSGTPKRLPTTGPRIPLSDPSMLIVTQTHEAKLCYFKSYASSMTILGICLSYTSAWSEVRPPPDWNPSPSGGARVCSHAAIKPVLEAKGNQIFIATRSHNYPLLFDPSQNPDYGQTDQTMPMDLSPDLPIQSSPSLWTRWGEENKISMAELDLKFDGNAIAVYTRLHNPMPTSRRGLTDLAFIGGSLALPEIYLVSTYLDNNDFEGPAKSALLVHSLSPPSNLPGRSLDYGAITKKCGERVFESEIIPSLLPSPYSKGFYACVVDSVEARPKSAKHGKERPLGRVVLVNLPDLQDNLAYEPTVIRAQGSTKSVEVPARCVVSTNQALVCTISSSLSSPCLSIHAAPWKSLDSESKESAAAPILSRALIAAIMSQRDTDDLRHALSLPSVSHTKVVDILSHALSAASQQSQGTYLSWEVLGFVMEVYRARANRVDDQAMKNEMTARWNGIHDLCSLSACNTAFHECKQSADARPYDLDAIWHLVDLSSWILGFIEGLLKECILFHLPRAKDDQNDNMNEVYDVAYPPNLFCLVAPPHLELLIANVQRVSEFHQFLISCNDDDDKLSVAKDVSLSIVDYTGLHLDKLKSSLESILEKAKKLPDDAVRENILTSQTSQDVKGHLQFSVSLLAESSGVNRARLFLQPDEFVDGLLSERGAKFKDRERDVVFKSFLPSKVSNRKCLRCGAHTNLAAPGPAPGYSSHRWRRWEKKWISRCICGGQWMVDNIRHQ